MSGLPVTYGRNVTTTPAGSGITIDGLLIQNGTVGPAGVDTSGILGVPVTYTALTTNDLLNYNGSAWVNTATPSVNSMTIINTPSSNTDATNKLYVDSAISGLTWKAAAEAGTTSNLSAVYNNGATGVGASLTNAGAQTPLIVDGYTTVVGDRIVVKDQTDAKQNGIYAVDVVGTGSTNWVLTRTSDADNSPANELDKASIFIRMGTNNADTAWTQSSTSVVIGVTNILFVLFSSATSVDLVMDDTAVPKYPQNDSQGVWFGLNTKMNAFLSDDGITIGKNAATGGASQIALGSGSNTGTGLNNLIVGVNSGNSLMTGSQNVGVGGSVLNATTSGQFNTAVGANALLINANGSSNVAVGQSLVGNVSGDNNIGIGNAGSALVSGDHNIMLGDAANCSATSNDTIAIGSTATAELNDAIAIGNTSAASANMSIAVGKDSVANVLDGVAIGRGATTNAIANSIAIGPTASPIDSAHSFALDINSNAVTPAVWGVTLNGAAYQIEKYTSLYDTTITTNGTTVLTVTDAHKQFFTGVLAETITLPVVSTLDLGFQFEIHNNSTGILTVQSSGLNTVSTIAAGLTTVYTVILPGGITAASWSTTVSGGAVTVDTFQTDLSGLTPSTASTGAVTLSGTLGAVSGGTGQMAYAVGDILYANTTSSLAKLLDVAVGSVLLSGGVGAAPSYGKVSLTSTVSGILPPANGGTGIANASTIAFGSFPLTLNTTASTNVTLPTSGTLVNTNVTALNSLISVGTITTGAWNATPISGSYGGTGQTSYTIGDLLYANTTSSLAKLPDVVVGSVLLSGGVGVAPSYGKVSLTSAVSSVLPTVSGGTGHMTYDIGDILYASTASNLAKLPDVAVGSVLLSGGVGAPPSYGKVSLSSAVSGILTPASGGTGVANSSTLTFGSFPLSLITTASTNVTLPTSGTLVNTTVTTLNSLASVSTITTGVWNATTIAAGYGGTGQSTYAVGDILYADTISSLSKLPDVAVGSVLLSGGVGTAPSYGKVSLSAAVSGVLPAPNGGTGQSVYVIGDLLYANTTSSLSKLADVNVGSVLLSGGIGIAPSYGKVSLTSAVSGVLPAVSGGTGQTAYAVGDLLYANTTSSLSKLADVVVGSVLLSGGIGIAPSYGKVSLSSAVSGILAPSNGGTGVANSSTLTFGSFPLNLTTTASTNVTLPTSGTLVNTAVTTLSSLASVGTIITGVWNATKISVNKGGTGLTGYTTGDLIYANSAISLNKLADVAVGSVLLSGGVGAAPTYGKVSLTSAVSGILSPASGGTGTANSSTIAFGAFPLTLSTSASTNVTLPTSGTLVNTAVTTLSSLASVGTIGTGVWNATTIAVNKGGTGLTSYTIGDMLYANSASSLAKVNIGANGTILTVTAGIPTWSTPAASVTSFSAGTTGLTPNSATTGAITLSGILVPANGGTGVANSSTITLAGNLVTAGAFPLTLTATAATNVTLPTSGTLVNTAVTTLSSLSSVGTIGTGVWNGTIIDPTYGGTGVANSSTITLAGNLATSGAFPLTVTTTAATNITLPTSGTLVNTAVTTLSSLVSVGTITTGTWNGTVVSPTYGGTGVSNSSTITVAGNLSTIGAFPLSMTTTAPTNITLPTSGTLVNTAVSTLSSLTSVGTITTGTWNGTTIDALNGGTGLTGYTAGDILYANSSTSLTKLGKPTNASLLKSDGVGVPSWLDLALLEVGLTVKQAAMYGTLLDLSATYNAAGGTVFTGAFVAVDFTNATIFDLDNAVVTGDVNGTTLTVTSISSGSIMVNQTISGAGITAGTKVTAFVSGTKGGAGVYTVDLSSPSTGSITINAVHVVVVGDRILVKDQTDAKQNGVYAVLTAGATGTMERSSDMDGTPASEVSAGSFIFITLGHQLANSGWVLEGSGILTLNTDNLDWAQFNGTGGITQGTGITISGNEIATNNDPNGGISSNTAANFLDFNTGDNSSILGNLPVSHGGTGAALTLVVGDILYANSTTSLAKLGVGFNTEILTLAGGVPSWAPPAASVTSFSSGTTGLTPNSATTGSITLSGVLVPANGGTGVANSSTITLGGNLVTSGAFPLTLTSTASTNVTLPTSGTLVNTAVTTLSSLASVGTITTGVWNGTSISAANGGTGISGGYTSGDLIYANGAASLTTLGVGANTEILTLAGGVPTWAAPAASVTSFSAGTTGFTPNSSTTGAVTLSGLLVPANGGTGVANSSTITLAGNLVTAGAFPLTLTTTASTNVTLPTSGTLVNTAVTTLSSLASIGTIGTGVWNATTIAVGKGGTGLTGYTAGDLIYADGASSLTKLSIGSNTEILTIAGGVPTWAAPAASVTSFSAGTTGLTPNSATTGAVTLSGLLVPANGGTGVANSSTITLAGNLVTAGAFPLTLTTTASTNVTLPTSGTLVNTAVTTLSSLASVGTIGTGVWNATTIAVGKGGTGLTGYTAGDIIYANGASSLTTVSIGSNTEILTITGGVPTWAAPASSVTSFSAGTTGLTPNSATTGAVTLSGLLAPANGGTGVANTNTITLGGNLVTAGTFSTSGSFPLTLTTTASTNVTLPTSGTLVNTAVTTLSSLASIGTIGTGVWNATTIAVGKGGTGLTGYTAGDLIYADGASSLTTVSIGSNTEILTITGGVPTWAAPASSVTSFSAGTTGLTPNSATTGAVTLSGLLAPANGGTGVANTNTITLGGNLVTAGTFSTSGSFPLTLTTTASTNVSLPTSGTLVNTAVTTLSSLTSVGTIGTGVWNATTIAVGKGGTGLTGYTAGDIIYANGASSLTTVSIGSNTEILTITGGVPTWAAPASSVTSFSAGTTGLTPNSATTGAVTLSGLLAPANGGTGVANSSTITLGGNLVTAGAFPLTLTTTASTNVTLPTSGTLVNTAVTTLSSLASIGTIGTGVWNATTIAVGKGGTGLTGYTAGDLIYADGASSLTQLSIGSNTEILTVVGGVPTWAAAPATGVTSATGTADQVIVSASTGAVTWSLPQSIATTSSPTFQDLTVTGHINTPVCFNTGNTTAVLAADNTGNTSNAQKNNPNPGSIWFSAVPTISGMLVEFIAAVGLSSGGNGTINIRAGSAHAGFAGPILSTQPVTGFGSTGNQLVVLPIPIAVTAGSPINIELFNTAGGGQAILQINAAGATAGANVRTTVNVAGNIGNLRLYVAPTNELCITDVVGTGGFFNNGYTEITTNTGGTGALGFDPAGTIGTTGQVLTVDGSLNPVWSTPTSGISTTLPSGNILVGNVSNVATSVAMSGDASISNAGVLNVTNISGSNAGGTGLKITSNTGANSSIYFGYSGSIPTSIQSVGIGSGALSSATGPYNTAVGFNALAANTNGDENTAFGSSAHSTGTGSTGNTAIGYNTLSVVGNFTVYNTAVGARAMQNNNDGIENTAVGASSMQSNTDGVENVAIGVSSLFTNTTGNDNIAIGYEAMRLNLTGNFCIGVGANALERSTVSNNIAIGHNGLLLTTTGADNTALGYLVGATLTTGADNTLIGSSADVAAAGTTNAIAIGKSVTAATNEVKIGNASNTQFTLGGASAIPALSFPNNYYAQQAGVAIGGMYRSNFNASITPVSMTANFTGANTLNVTAITGTPIVVGALVTGSAGVVDGTYITGFGTGLGGIGTYTTDNTNVVAAITGAGVLLSSNPDIIYIRTV